MFSKTQTVHHLSASRYDPNANANTSDQSSSNAARTMASGMITPPESPVEKFLRGLSYDESNNSSLADSLMDAPEVQEALEQERTVSTRRCQSHQKTHITDKHGQHDKQESSRLYLNTNYRHISSDPLQQSGLDSLKEDILSVVEDAIEKHIADATAPLRMNVSRLHQENVDLKDQNDTYNRQIELHYQTLQQSTDLSNSHIKSLGSLQEATTDNLTTVTNLVGHLSQVIANLPQAINQVVYDATQQQTQTAISHIIHAERESMLRIHQQSSSQTRFDAKQPSPKSWEQADQGRDVRELVATIVKELQSQNTVVATQKSSRRRVVLRRMFGRLFRGSRRQ